MSRHSHHHAVVAPAEVLDPVCGMTISPDDAVGHVDHKGRTYYFCSQSCLDQFRTTPDAFLGEGPAVAATSSEMEREYTCPMDPDVRQKGPGACPKCGMSSAMHSVETDIAVNAVHSSGSDLIAGLGYTPNVGLNQRTISVVVLTILTALPVSGMLCAMVCDSSAKATASAHHRSGTDCEETRPASTGTQIQGVSEHDCNMHDAAVRQATSTVAERADGVAGSVLLATPAVRAITTAPIRVKSTFDYDVRGTAPPTTAPLVLRV